MLGLTINTSNNSKFKIYPFNSNNEIFYSIKINDNSNLMTFHNNQMIGIGTANPISKLNLHNGSFRITTDNNNNSLDINNNSISFLSKASIINDNDYNISMFGKYEIKEELIINECRSIVNIWNKTTDDKPRFYFSSNSTSIFSSPNGYQWNNSNNFSIINLNNNGNLGIGISTPFNNLHINSFNNYPLKISSFNNNNYGTFISLNTNPVEWSKCLIGHIKTSNYDIGDIIFATNDNADEISANITDERLRITSKGLIGIGITEPKVNLHLNSREVQLKLTDNNSNGLLLGKSNNSFIINEDLSDLIIASGGNNASIIINSNGIINLPIGIIKINNLPFINFNNNSNFHISSDKTRIIINSPIGIGTIPIELFHTQGIIASINENTSNHIRIFNDNSSGFLDIGSSNNGFGIRINSSGKSYGTSIDYKERFRISTDGNIGIGNNNPFSYLSDTNLIIGNSSLNNSSGTLILSKGSQEFKRHFKLGYGSLNYMTIGDFGSNNQPGIWKEQVRIHHNSPNNSLIVYENGDLNVFGRMYQTSDRKIKKEIKIIENALEKVEKLNGIEFKSIYNDINQIGLIAQEVEEIIPEVVDYNQETKLKSVAYANLVPLLINAIKELNKKINNL